MGEFTHEITMMFLERNYSDFKKTVCIKARQFNLSEDDVASKAIENMSKSPYNSDKANFKSYISRMVEYSCLNIWKSTVKFVDLDSVYDISATCSEPEMWEAFETLKAYLSRLDNADFVSIKKALQVALNHNKKTTLNVSKDILSEIYFLIREAKLSMTGVLDIMDKIEQDGKMLAVMC